MITVEDIKNMTQSELEALVEAGKTELNQRHKVNVEKAWVNFFQAADVLLRLGEQINVDWDDPYDDEHITITQLGQFSHFRDKGKVYPLSLFLTFRKNFVIIYMEKIKEVRKLSADLVKALMQILTLCISTEDCKTCALREFCGKVPSDWC